MELCIFCRKQPILGRIQQFSFGNNHFLIKKHLEFLRSFKLTLVFDKKLMNFNKIDNLRNDKSSKLTVTWVPRDRRRVNEDDPEDELESFWFNVFWKFNEKIGVIYRSVRDVFDRERLLRDDPYLYFCIFMNSVSL